jgi:phosphosulfolactate phosphohydrolase-like enzyme
VFEEPLTTADLLEQWREATRAAQLAERLAELAKASVERADRDAAAAEGIAEMAEQTATHAERAARVAREAANHAQSFAQQERGGRLAEGDVAVAATRADETDARERYHAAHAEARNRHEAENSVH